MLRQDRDRQASCLLRAHFPDGAAQSTLQRDLQDVRTSAISAASREISRLGESMKHRLNLPEVCTPHSRVVHFELFSNLSPRVPQPAPLYDRLGELRKAPENFVCIDRKS